jgi:hypothetical protein
MIATSSSSIVGRFGGLYVKEIVSVNPDGSPNYEPECDALTWCDRLRKRKFDPECRSFIIHVVNGVFIR